MVDTFMLAFWRFVSCKSLPHIMMSDNASTYLSTMEDLKEMLNLKELETLLGRCGIKWKLIPKRALWYGGYWERLIGLTKATLKKVLGRVHISLPMLQTMVVKVEATLNDRSRSLTYLSDDLMDPQPPHAYLMARESQPSHTGQSPRIIYRIHIIGTHKVKCKGVQRSYLYY